MEKAFFFQKDEVVRHDIWRIVLLLYNNRYENKETPNDYYKYKEKEYQTAASYKVYMKKTH